MTDLLGSGADGQVVVGRVVDETLKKDLRERLKQPEGPVKVAIKMFCQTVKQMTDADATELDPEQE